MSTDYDFSTSIPVIGGPKKANTYYFGRFLNIYIFVIMKITTILNELFYLNLI
jgi:hypothetical protein